MPTAPPGWRARPALIGIHPDLVFVDDGPGGRPRVTSLAPRGPIFIASARAPSRGPSSYPLPYLGPERVSLDAPEPWPGGGRFGEILARGMAREVGARPSAAELADALEALAG